MIVYSAPNSADMLPIIDLAPSFDGKAGRAAVAGEIRRACRDTGFFYVINHGVDPALVDGAFAAANRFFDLPCDRKMEAAKEGDSNGYEPTETQRLDNASPPDIKESFNFCGSGEPGTPGYKPNRWPSNLAGFEDDLRAYYDALDGLGLHVSRLIALSLDLDFHHFDGTFSQQRSPLRILRYPPQPNDAEFNQIGAGAHTDWGWITLLAQDSLGGLEVETASGEWVRAEPVPGSFLVNLGDLLHRWTNGLYHSSLHRVMNNRSGRNRHSIVLFYNQAYDTPVECLPTCRAPGETPKFPPCTAGEHSMQRYRESRPQTQQA